MSSDLSAILRPKSVAIIGASTDVKKWGYRGFQNITTGGYSGRLYLVNPRGGEFAGRKIYSSVLEIDDDIDIAVTPLPINAIENVVKECAQKGIKGIVIITAGFGEIDEDGARIEKNLLDLAREGKGTRIIGPNCMGLICNPSNLFLTQSYRVGKGSIAFVSQSGNLGIALLDLAAKNNLGFSYFLSIGNQLDIQFHEYIEFLRDDPDTKTIVLYVESIREGRKFLEAVSQTIRKKPIIVYKAGQTQAGSRSARSHTGSIAGEDSIYDAAFKQFGIIRIYNVDELLETAEAFDKCPLPKNNHMAILGGGGGHATTFSDACERFGLEVPVFSPDTQEKLKKVLLPRSAYRNPIDFAGASDGNLPAYEKCAEACFQDPNIGGVIIYGVFGGYRLDLQTPGNTYDESAQALGRLMRAYQKPILLQTTFGRDHFSSLNILRQEGIPVNESVEVTASCMASLWKYSSYLVKAGQYPREKLAPIAREGKKNPIIEKAIHEGLDALLETDAKELLKSYEIPTPEFKLAKNMKEAVAFAKDLGESVAMKIVSPDIIHKTDAGGVQLNIKGENNIRKGFKEILENAQKYNPNARIKGVMISPFLPKGKEVIIGMKKDAQFGPVIMFGLGGIFVDVLKDVSFRIAPLLEIDAMEMVREIKGYPILEGVRGEPRCDIQGIVDALLKVSQLAMDHPEISELDLNPLMVYEKGVTAVDARIILSPNSTLEGR